MASTYMFFMENIWEEPVYTFLIWDIIEKGN